MDTSSSPPKKRRRRLRGGGADSDTDEDAQSSRSEQLSLSLQEEDEAEEREIPSSENANSRSSQRKQKRGPRGLEEFSDDESYEGSKRSRDKNEDDESEGEDILENAEKDYKRIDELDKYDDSGLDNEQYEAISLEARRQAEQIMTERDRESKARTERLPQALQESSEEESDDEAEQAYRRKIRSQFERAANLDILDADPEPIDLHNFNVPLREWIQRQEVVAEVKRQFADFLRNFKDPGNPSIFYYRERINDMCARNTQSLLLSYLHLSSEKPTLAIWLADLPKELLKLLDVVAQKVVLEYFESYGDIHDEIFVRITDLPLKDSLRDLRTLHLNSLVRVSGVVTRRTSVLPMLKTLFYRCTCGNKIGPIEHDMEYQPVKPNCCSEGTVSLDEANCVYRNYQRILLQESPGTVPAGRVPRYKDVVLLSDLIDCARPGEEVEITGIYLNKQSRAMNNQQGFPVFRTIIEANYVAKQQDLFSTIQITDEDRENFRKMAKSPHIAQRIIGSIAPSIYGCEHVKTALAMAMFGGQEKNVNNKHRIRGDINVLLMGDPGTAKSQFLKFTEKTAPRAVYTTGKGASAVGLTAAVQKDPITREWVLEGGALVLADRGVCLIDEFDKMNDQDRTSIHEAMEQQSISISKAGIVTTLQARCAVIAAANPIDGRYDPQRSFAENVELTDPIIQRFDILCVLQDTVDPIADERLAKFVVSSHVKSHPDGCISLEEAENDKNKKNSNINTFSSWSANNDPPGGLVEHDVLKKYILHARSLKPVLHSVDSDKIATLYGELRRESVNSGGVPIAVRHMESIIRMAEAHARMHLRESVNQDDIDMAIRVALESFIQAQKHSVKRSLRRSFQKYIIYKKDSNQLLMYLLQELVKDNQHYSRLKHNQAIPNRIEIASFDFERKARELGIRDVNYFIKSELFRQRGFKTESIKAGPHAGYGKNNFLIIKEFS